VNRRLESEEGISYTEFSYLVLQAYDFVQLFDRHGCTLQMGGSDQWGNITAGIDLIRKLRAQKAHGLVWPLMTTSSGQKFGKTEAGAVWLDAARTTPFKFYQFWLNTDDRDVVQYLKFFTFLNRERITSLEVATRLAPEQREAQRVLAREVTTLVHGPEAADRAETSAQAVFSQTAEVLSDEELLAMAGDAPTTELSPAELSGLKVVDLLVKVGLAPSKSEARRLVQSGAIRVHGELVVDPLVPVAELVVGLTVFVVSKGKRHKHLVRLT
jgi:tyrosyl-tRNA synthetase